MIGPAYWSTGIKIHQGVRGAWSVSLDFYDDGFAEDGSTEGTLRVRYEGDLDASVDLLKADAERLGIIWRTPTVYSYDLSGDVDPPSLCATADAQARRLGWEECYRAEGPLEEAYDGP